MNIRLFIYISILSIFSSSQSMEFIKKKIKQKNIHKDKNTNIITKEFFATQRIYDNKTLPREIIIHIQKYCLLLHNEDLEKSRFAKEWNNFSIPQKFYPLLTLKQ